MAKYKQRIADRLLKRKVLGKGAVLIEGPKWCGKTTTAKQLAKSVLDLADASVLKQSTQMIEISPKSLLEGTTPRLIDEWQALPPIWDSIRSEVDKRGEPSQFILTGSSVLPDADETIHSGSMPTYGAKSYNIINIILYTCAQKKFPIVFPLLDVSQRKSKF